MERSLDGDIKTTFETIGTNTNTFVKGRNSFKIQVKVK